MMTPACQTQYEAYFERILGDHDSSKYKATDGIDSENSFQRTIYIYLFNPLPRHNHKVLSSS